MNPRPPGYQPSLTRSSGVRSTYKVNYGPSVCVEITDGLVEEFFEWLRRVNPRIGKSLRDYSYYIPRLVGVKLCGKEGVSRAFEAMGGLNKSSYEAFRRFLTFIEKTREMDELVSRLKKALPRKPRAREDTYVPPDSLILKVSERVKALGAPYTLVYDVLVSTGCRLREALYLIKNAGKLKAVRLGRAVRIHVDLQRGSKNEFVMYVPLKTYEQLLNWQGRLPHPDSVEKAFRQAGLAVKYFRKWWRQTLKKLGVDSEDIEAFQGRVSSVGGRHYTDWIPILDEDYRRVLPHLKKFIIGDSE